MPADLRGTADWRTIPEITGAAKAALPREIWDYISGGADSETTLRRNRRAFERLMLKPRVLRDMRKVDLSTTLLGHRLALPFFPTAIGSLELASAGGAVESARVATGLGTTACVSILSAQPIGDMAAAASGPLILQVYMAGDERWFADVAAEAKAAGFMAIAVTIDTARYGRRDRDLTNRFSSREAVDRPGLAGTDAARRDEYRAAFDWTALDRLRPHCDLPLILKGIGCPEDALMAVARGIDCLYVSNHGGRQLDHGPAALDQLDAIAQAVGTRAELIMDSGVLRGTDVLKALALGARAVGLGRLQACALAAGGAAGLRWALGLLAEELEIAMALCGAASVAEVDRLCLWPGSADPV